MDKNTTLRIAGPGFISDAGEIKHVDSSGSVDGQALWGTERMVSLSSKVSPPDSTPKR